MLQAMERMFDECLPISNSGVRHQRVPAVPHVKDGVKKSINGASACSLQQGAGSHRRGRVPHVRFNVEHIQGDLCSPYDHCDRRNSDCILWDDLSIPKFVGREDPKAYIVWEEKCEYLFGVHRVLDGQQVHLAATKFYGYALTWWNDVQENQHVLGRDHINTWAEMKQVMRRRFAPSYHHHKQQQRHHKIDDCSTRSSSKAVARYSVQQNTFQHAGSKKHVVLRENKHFGQREKVRDAKVQKYNGKKDDHRAHK
jgi:hypothetical protein